jgi:phosphomethylpyrimidine synthase
LSGIDIVSTQIEKAKKGEITGEMRYVSQVEKIDLEKLVGHIASGKVVIPKNANRNFNAIGIGKDLRTKINANLGTSPMLCNGEYELEKLAEALKYGADTVMDLSTGGNLDEIRMRMLDNSQVPLGTVPIYELIKQLKDRGGSDDEWTKEELFEIIERQAEQGVDFMTLHAGVTIKTVEALRNADRMLGIVSRGGSLIAAWITKHRKENPLYECFDELMDILYKYDVTISLGDGLRPGAIFDASDIPQISELIVLGELTQKAWSRNVQVMIEGPGHIPLDEIVMNVQMQKKMCHDAPFYVLGPLVCDIAPGYDEIVGAIGGAIAASAGADFLCYVTPAEHLALPQTEDVRRGVIASRIAAHAADIVKGVPAAREWDDKMSLARAELDWETQLKLALDPERAREKRERIEIPVDESGRCTMCGEFCAIATTTRAGLQKKPAK